MRHVKGIIVGALALLAFGCGGSVATSRAHVRFVDMVPDGSPIDFYVQGTRVKEGAEYLDATGYALYDPGTTTFSITGLGQSTILAQVSGDVQAPLDYTVVAVGRETPPAGQPGYQLVLLPEQGGPATSTTSFIRIANVAPAELAFDVYVTAPNVDLNTVTPTYSNLAFGTVSDYGSYAVGSRQIRVTPVGSKSVLFDKTLIMLGKQVRTLYVRDSNHGGLPLQSSLVVDGN